VEIIIEVIEEYELGGNIGYFVTDNAPNNNTAVDHVIYYYFPHLRTKKQRLCRRLCCLSHVINLAVKAFLFRG